MGMRRRRRHRRRHRNRGVPGYEQSLDIVATSVAIPVIANGSYIHGGSEVRVCLQLEQLPAQAEQMAQKQTPINHLQLMIVGTKVEAGSGALVCVTIVLFVCLIFPIFFMCCDWWRRRTQGIYSVNPKTYQAVSDTLNAVPTLNNLSLHVADNGLNQEKVQIIYDMVRRARLSAFTFSNRAFDFDWKEQEHSRFVENMQPILETGVPCEMSWGNQILGSMQQQE